MSSIHVINEGAFYQLYGIVTLIITMLLLWYFIRSNISVSNCEGFNTYDAVLQDGTVLTRRSNLASVDETDYNDRANQDAKIRAIHALSSNDKLDGNFRLRGLVDNDITDVVNSEDSNTHREGLNNPSGVPYNDFEELALPFTTTKYPVGNVQLTDADKPKPYNMQVGLYGGVPVTFYNEEDMLHSPEWYHGVGSGLYIQNSRTLHRNVNWPWQKTFW